MADETSRTRRCSRTSCAPACAPRSRATRSRGGADWCAIIPGGHEAQNERIRASRTTCAAASATACDASRQRVARCQAATDAASWISFARTIRSTSARAKRRAIRPCSVCSSACSPGSRSGRAPDVDGLVGEPVGEVQAAEGLQRRRPQPGLLGQLAARQRLAASGDVLPRALRELPEALADRVAELLDQPDGVVLERHDRSPTAASRSSRTGPASRRGAR